MIALAIRQVKRYNVYMKYKTDKQWYSAEQAAQLLGFTRQNIEQHKDKGNIRSVYHANIGTRGMWLYHIDDIIKFADSKHYVSGARVGLLADKE